MYKYKILSNFKLKNKDALIFVDWLFSDSAVIGETISSYYLRILNKIIDKFKLSEVVTVECMSGELLQKNNDELLRKFKENTDLQELYIEALNMDGKKDTTDFPFYSVSKKDGERLLSIDRYLNNPNEYIVAPKVLMLNNFENLVLPYHAIEKNNVYAREIMYSNSNINCNQVFCDDKWFDHIVSFNTDINLDPVERELYDKLDISIQKLKQFEVTSNSVQDEYKNWIIESTNIAFDQAKLTDKKMIKKNTPRYNTNDQEKHTTTQKT